MEEKISWCFSFPFFCFSTDRHPQAYEQQLDINEGVLIKDGERVCVRLV